TISPGQSSVLTLTTTASLADGGQSFTIQGISRALTRNITGRLEAGAIWSRFRHDARGLGRSAFVGPLVFKYAWGGSYGLASYSSPAIGADGTIYYGTRGSGGSSGRLVASRPSDGRLPWTFLVPTGQSVDSSPALGIDGTIYFGADDGQLYALRPDGSPKWALPL